MMDPILAEFTAAVRRRAAAARRRVPFLSNVSGDVDHRRAGHRPRVLGAPSCGGPVRFGTVSRTLLAEAGRGAVRRVRAGPAARRAGAHAGARGSGPAAAAEPAGPGRQARRRGDPADRGRQAVDRGRARLPASTDRPSGAAAGVPVRADAALGGPRPESTLAAPRGAASERRLPADGGSPCRPGVRPAPARCPTCRRRAWCSPADERGAGTARAAAGGAVAW